MINKVITNPQLNLSKQLKKKNKYGSQPKLINGQKKRNISLPRIQENINQVSGEFCHEADPIQTLLYLPWISQKVQNVKNRKRKSSSLLSIRHKRQFNKLIQEQNRYKNLYQKDQNEIKSQQNETKINRYSYSVSIDKILNHKKSVRTEYQTNKTVKKPVSRLKIQLNKNRMYINFLEQKIEESLQDFKLQTEKNEPINNDFSVSTNTKLVEKLKKNVKKGLKKDDQWFQVDNLKSYTYFVRLLLEYKKIEDSQSLIEQKISKKHIVLPEKQQLTHFIKKYELTNKSMNISQLIKSKDFLIINNSQNLYFGQINREQKNGNGVYISKNYTYEGVWKNNMKVQGYQITKLGVYRGKFSKNQRNDMGEFVWYNGQSYSGQWKNGNKNGAGIWKSGKGDTYVGNWIDGKVQGYGVHITRTGQKYEGNFHNFLKQGQGRQTFPNGDLYEGQYTLGKPHGIGKYFWKKGLKYQGEFREGFRHGKGQLIHDKFKYIGQFSSDLPEGNGQIFYENGDQYKGQIKAGQKHGKGTLNIKNTRQLLTGQWKKNNFQN